MRHLGVLLCSSPGQQAIFDDGHGVHALLYLMRRLSADLHPLIHVVGKLLLARGVRGAIEAGGGCSGGGIGMHCSDGGGPGQGRRLCRRDHLVHVFLGARPAICWRNVRMREDTAKYF
eukprot:TRINITY_DN827_c0_g1_i7.p2 TRINITY_DN827_c0_g1~~TRINITY_DN827_c0_g1_i7.p2  ORF type:complete len:118 (-),score=20.08 TRINITY_DN827_c0_g1_i7:657-1010(-)